MNVECPGCGRVMFQIADEVVKKSEPTAERPKCFGWYDAEHKHCKECGLDKDCVLATNANSNTP